MKKYLGLFSAVCFLIVGFGFTTPSIAAAQDQAAAPTQPPKILAIHREFIKPTAIGSVHQQSENSLAQAMAQANSPDHYMAWVGLTGKLRVLFVSGFNSMADYQQSVQRMDLGNNSSESQAYDRLQGADGKLLTEMDSAVFAYQPDLSLNGAVDIAHMRFAEITTFKVKPGHEADFAKANKLYANMFGNVAGAHWAAFQMMYGGASGIYLFVVPVKSLAEIDADHKAMGQAMTSASADQMRQLNELETSSIDSVTSNIYAFDPTMSYVGEKWKSVDPSFWKQ